MERSLVLAGLILVSLAAASSMDGATRQSMRPCLTQAGVKVSNSPANQSLGSLGDIDLDFPSYDWASLSFDSTSAAAQRSTDLMRAANNPGPVYRVGTVTVSWAMSPSQLERETIRTCIRLAGLDSGATDVPGISAGKLAFSGSGSRNIAAFTLSREATLRWSGGGGLMIISNNFVGGPDPGVTSQATSGTTLLPAGTYRLTINALSPWRIRIN